MGLAQVACGWVVLSPGSVCCPAQHAGHAVLGPSILEHRRPLPKKICLDRHRSTQGCGQVSHGTSVSQRPPTQGSVTWESWWPPQDEHQGWGMTREPWHVTSSH